MKKDIYTIISVTILILAVWSCENKNSRMIPSEKITTEYHDIADYSGLKINDAFTAEVNFTENPQPIEVIANENLHPYIEISKSADALNVGLQRDISIDGKAELKVVLYCGSLSDIIGNDASLIQLKDSLMAGTVNINLNGASNVSGIIEAEKLMVYLRDASLLDLAGQTDDLNLTLSGASRMRGFEFSCLDFVADFSDASSAELTVHSTINVKASDASQLKYRGDAVITNQDLSGASSVSKDSN